MWNAFSFIFQSIIHRPNPPTPLPLNTEAYGQRTESWPSSIAFGIVFTKIRCSPDSPASLSDCAYDSTAAHTYIRPGTVSGVLCLQTELQQARNEREKKIMWPYRNNILPLLCVSANHSEKKTTYTMLSAASCNSLQASNQLQEATVHIFLLNNRHPSSATTRTTISQWMSYLEEMCSRNRMWYRGSRCVWCCVQVIMLPLCLSLQVHSEGWSEIGGEKMEEMKRIPSEKSQPWPRPTSLVRSVFPWFPFDQQAGRCSSMLRLIQAF